MMVSPELSAGRIVYHLMQGDTLRDRAWVMFERIAAFARAGNPYAIRVRRGIANIARKLQARSY